MKHTFLKPLFLLRPIIGETLLLYLEVSIDALSVLLLIEVSTNHNSIYFISKALTDSCTHCQKIDKISLGIMITLRKLCFYFLSHSCVGCTYQPLKQVLFRLNLVWRMTKLYFNSLDFDISFEHRKL